MENTVFGWTVGVLDCKNVRNLQKVVEKNPRSSFFRSFLALIVASESGEPALAKQEVVFWQFGQKKRKLSGGERICDIVAAIGEDVFLFGMGMEVDKHSNSMPILKNIFFDLVYLLASVCLSISPTSIQVETSYVAPRIAQNYPIWVHYRNYLHYIVLEELIYDMILLLLKRTLQKQWTQSV